MRIEFEQTVDHEREAIASTAKLNAARKALGATSKSPVPRWVVWLLAVGFYGAPFVMVLGAAYLAIKVAAPWWGLVVPLAWFQLVVLFPGRRRGGERMKLKDRLGSGRGAVEIDDAGFRFFGDDWRAEIDWDGIVAFDESVNLILVEDLLGQVYAIPALAFSSGSAKEEFTRMLAEKTNRNSFQP